MVREDATAEHAAGLAGPGRAGQGRLLEALAHYRELHDQPNPEDLLPDPEEVSIAVRTDLWARQRVAELFRHAPRNSRR